MITLLCAALLAAGPSNWTYPDAEITFRAGDFPGGDFAGATRLVAAMTTDDDFSTVVRFFEKRAGRAIEVSQGRPVSLAIVARWFEDVAIVAVVSRTEAEGRTHIGLSYNSGRSRGAPPNPLDWTYPHAKVTQPGRTTTGDEYAAVVKYYQQKAGAIRKDGTPVENGAISTRDLDVDVIDDAQRRPVALKVIVRRWEGASAAVVISRAKDEKETHIDLIYRKDQEAPAESR
jgi:hypothetical protein